MKEFISNIWGNIRWFFRKIRRVIEFIPHIWRGYDFDSQYAVDLFKYQLERMATFLESEKALNTRAKEDAQRIRTTLRLMEKVYDEDYACEYQDKMKELYGKEAMEYNFIKDGTFESGQTIPEGHYLLEQNWENYENAGEINEMQSKLFKESSEKQEKAHRILWEMIEHRIRWWWD